MRWSQFFLWMVAQSLRQIIWLGWWGDMLLLCSWMKTVLLIHQGTFSTFFSIFYQFFGVGQILRVTSFWTSQRWGQLVQITLLRLKYPICRLKYVIWFNGEYPKIGGEICRVCLSTIVCLGYHAHIEDYSCLARWWPFMIANIWLSFRPPSSLSVTACYIYLPNDHTVWLECHSRGRSSSPTSLTFVSSVLKGAAGRKAH